MSDWWGEDKASSLSGRELLSSPSRPETTQNYPGLETVPDWFRLPSLSADYGHGLRFTLPTPNLDSPKRATPYLRAVGKALPQEQRQ